MLMQPLEPRTDQDRSSLHETKTETGSADAPFAAAKDRTDRNVVAERQRPAHRDRSRRPKNVGRRSQLSVTTLCMPMRACGIPVTSSATKQSRTYVPLGSE